MTFHRPLIYRFTGIGLGPGLLLNKQKETKQGDADFFHVACLQKTSPQPELVFIKNIIYAAKALRTCFFAVKSYARYPHLFNSHCKRHFLGRQAFFIIAGLEFHGSAHIGFNGSFQFYLLHKFHLTAVLIGRNVEFFISE